ncbi:MAG: hypothetical protein Q9184_004388 [Pyrenodesmia sp. 2 TL-2023]
MRVRTSYPAKVGLYTSPHIKNVRERIQINSVPISEEMFAGYFFQIWDKIAPLDPCARPGYFGFLTLMSFDIFLRERVTMAIYETGIGGEYDTTNVIQSPVVTGITSLGIDHEKTLKVPIEQRPTYFTTRGVAGSRTDIEDIAWHKAGIFKPGRPAFSVRQQPRAEDILRKRAEERGAPLSFIEASPEVLAINLPSRVHSNNAALAAALVEAFLESKAAVHMDIAKGKETFARGLKNARLPGRCQHLKKGPHEWYIDGAHTEDSLAVAGHWFAGTADTSSSEISILIFNHQSQRDGDALLISLSKSLQSHKVTMNYAIFCTNTLQDKGAERGGKTHSIV